MIKKKPKKAPKQKRCSICKKRLSKYNKGKVCFCHSVNEENEKVFDAGDVEKNKDLFLFKKIKKLA